MKLVRYGYTYQMHIEVDQAVLIIERDEEQNYRVLESTNSISDKQINHELLQKIIDTLKSLGD